MSEMSLMTGTIRIIMNLYSYGQEVMWMYIGDSDIGEIIEYYGAAEPPVRCGESHLSGLTEPPIDSYSA